MSDGFEKILGFEKLIETVGELYKRLRRRCEREDTPPILGCVQANPDPTPGSRKQPAPQSGTALVHAVAARLNVANSRLRVPHALVDLDPDPSNPPADAELAPVSTVDVEELRNVLTRIADGLATGNGGSYRFPRFWLAVWLMSEVVPGKTVDARRDVLRDRLYQRSVTRASRGGTEPGEVAADLPVWLRLLWIVLLPLFFWARHSGKVPGIGRTYRWFLKQSDVAPGNDTFFELALRLTENEWPRQKEEQVARLLVNAFLEDLRDDFRGSAWIRRYHTPYPIVLLDGITRRNGGYTLLRMVAEVRNDTYLFDPLLLITTSRRVPPLAKPPKADESTGGGPVSLVDDWKKRREGESRQRQIVAWLIPITIGAAPKESATQTAPSRPSALRRGLGDALLPTAAAKAAAAKVAASKAAAAAKQPPENTTPPRYLDGMKRPWWRTRRGGGLIMFVVLGLVGGGYAGFGFATTISTVVTDSPGSGWSKLRRRSPGSTGRVSA